MSKDVAIELAKSADFHFELDPDTDWQGMFEVLMERFKKSRWTERSAISKRESIFVERCYLNGIPQPGYEITNDRGKFIFFLDPEEEKSGRRGEIIALKSRISFSGDVGGGFGYGIGAEDWPAMNGIFWKILVGPMTQATANSIGKPITHHAFYWRRDILPGLKDLEMAGYHISSRPGIADKVFKPEHVLK